MTENKSNIRLESDTYDIIRNRLVNQAGELTQRLDQLNQRRRDIFGAIETKLMANDRINTSNYCIARDIVAIGDRCLFGYNVHIGLRSGIKLEDVFSCYRFDNHRFSKSSLDLLADEKFETDFLNLYRYYKDAYFARFFRRGAFLYMVFHIAKEGNDFKSFKWLIRENELVYVDARSDHEVKLPGAI